MTRSGTFPRRPGLRILVTTDAGRVKTWTWDGSDWTQQQTSVSPRPSSHVAMTYDTHSDRVLLVAFAEPVPYYGPVLRRAAVTSRAVHEQPCQCGLEPIGSCQVLGPPSVGSKSRPERHTPQMMARALDMQ